MSKLLIDEPPLQVLPGLACAIGLTEALIVQQLHWVLKFQRTELEAGRIVREEGKTWWRAGYRRVAAQFPFFSEVTVKRALARLRELGLVESRELGEAWNRELSWTICYGAFQRYESPSNPHGTSADQIDPLDEINLSASSGSVCRQTDPLTIEEKKKPKEAAAAAALGVIVMNTEDQQGVEVALRKHGQQAMQEAVAAVLETGRRPFLSNVLKALGSRRSLNTLKSPGINKPGRRRTTEKDSDAGAHRL